VVNCRVGSEANDRAVWRRSLGKCMYVCLENVLLLGPARKLCVRTPSPGTMRNTSSVKQLHTFCRGTDMERPHEMPLKSSETADGKGIGRGEWSPASRRCTYVTPSVWRVNPSGMLKKLRNTSSKQTFDSIYRYRHRETRLSTSRLKAVLIASREASCVLYVCTSYGLICTTYVESTHCNFVFSFTKIGPSESV